MVTSVPTAPLTVRTGQTANVLATPALINWPPNVTCARQALLALKDVLVQYSDCGVRNGWPEGRKVFCE